MSKSLEREIAALPNMNRAQLRAMWQQKLKEKPPLHVRRQLFVLILAYKLQEQAYGGLKPEIRRQLEKIAARYRGVARAKDVPIMEPRRIKPGTRLLRQWNGKTHQVTVASLIQELKAEGLFGVELYKPEPGSDKFMRLAAQAIKFEESRVRLPDAAPWLEEYVRELTGFPGSKYDDQVDSTSQALDFMSSKRCRPSIFDVVF